MSTIDRDLAKGCAGIGILMLGRAWDAIINMVSWQVITANWFNLALFVYMVLVTAALVLVWWRWDKLTAGWCEHG